MLKIVVSTSKPVETAKALLLSLAMGFEVEPSAGMVKTECQTQPIMSLLGAPNCDLEVINVMIC